MSTQPQNQDQINRALHQDCRAIAEIVLNGGVAVVVYEPDPENLPALRDFGWDGKSAVFKLRWSGALRMAQGCAEVGDHVTGRWLFRRGTHRVLLAMHKGSLLFNYSENGGWSLEPGSTDHERAKAA